MICPESLGARVSGLVATKMHCRIRGFIYVGLGSVRGCEHDVVSGLDQGHRRNDGFIEIIARGAGAALNLDAGGVGTEYKNFAFCHWFLLSLTSIFLSKIHNADDLSIRSLVRFKYPHRKSALPFLVPATDATVCLWTQTHLDRHRRQSLRAQ